MHSHSLMNSDDGVGFNMGVCPTGKLNFFKVDKAGCDVVLFD